MAHATKEFEIELNDGRLLNVTVTVEGIHESDYGADADGNRGVDKWLLGDYVYVADEDLNGPETAEVEAIIDDLIEENDWDFEDGEDYNSDDDSWLK